MSAAAMDGAVKPTLTQGFTLALVYALGSVFMGIALAFATFHFLYPGSVGLGMPLVLATACLLAMLACWITMPLNRPHFGALTLRVVMIWSLGIAGAILRRRLSSHEHLAPHEAAVLVVAVILFLTGVLISRGSSWGKRWLH